MATHFRTCPLCEAMCGLAIETDGPRVTSVRGDTDDPFSRGFICPKGAALAAIHHDPDRLQKPIARRGRDWVELEWSAALELAADGIHRVQARHGRDAAAIYFGNPTVHNVSLSLFGPSLSRALRTKNRFSATSVDQLPHHLAAHWMFGHQLLLPIPDIDRTMFMLIVGANPVASNGSLMSAPGVRHRLEAIEARGGKVVVVDPRRTETAAIASEHHFIRPGADAWLLAAILRVALVEGRGLGRHAPYVERLPELERALNGFDISAASAHTGIDTASIERLGRELCAAESAVVYGRFGVSTQAFGGLCQWLINAINLVSGNLDRPGGAMFTRPAVDAVNAPLGMGISPGSHGRWKSRVRGLPEIGGELPVATLAEEIETAGEGRIRALVTVAGNPVLSTPNGKRLDAALANLEHMVSFDCYLNETTRHASVILPPPSPLERPHYDVVFNHLAVRNIAKFSSPLFAPPTGQLEDHVAILELARLVLQKRGELGARERLSFAAMKRLGPRGLLAAALRVGPYGVRAFPPRKGLTLKALEASPHGVDLGALEPCLPARLCGRRRTIDIAPAQCIADLARLAKNTNDAAENALRLIGRRHPRSNNSWMHNAPKLMAGKPICTLLIHPHDAALRGVTDGMRIRLRSSTGEIAVEAELNSDVMPGVVCMPHGFGHSREGVRLSVATAHAGASFNDLTDPLEIDELSGNAVLSNVLVTVEPEARS